ncbi:hypothetical protein C2E23DRAFT_875560 [Lenzites betulinus]|nr:hypothetical protein C2E23DRAFT_875560 [Lenzites betulinus]
MGSAGNESRNDESQASLLLAAALRPRELLPNPPANEESHVSDESLPSSGSTSVHYHMNGLQPTQTQSLHDSQDAACGEGSQKENAPAPLEKSPPLPQEGSPRRVHPDSYPSPPLEAPSAAKEKGSTTMPPSKGELDFPLGKTMVATKAVAFTSYTRPMSRPFAGVSRTAMSTNPMPPPRRMRSPSPASQDSFAGPPARDPAVAYIEQDEAFQIPLVRPGDDLQALSDGEDGPPPVSSNMWAPPSRNRATELFSRSGKVLVQGTPSNSSRSNDSQSQSQSQFQLPRSPSHDAESQQSDGDTQESDSLPPGQRQAMEIDLPSFLGNTPIHTDDEDHDQDMSGLPATQPTQSDASTEPSSSYERLVNQDPFAPLSEATQPAHVPVDETQVFDYSKPSHDADASIILQNHDFYNDNGQVVFPSVPSAGRSANTTNSTIRSSVPRGLLGLVAPHKRYRYLDVTSTPVAPTQIAPERAYANTSPEVDETQLIEDSAPMIPRVADLTQPSHTSAINEIVQSTLPKRSLPTATRVLQELRARRQYPSTDVVPDSEELRIVPDSDPPLPPSVSPPPAGPPTARSSPTKPRSRRGLQSEDEVLRAVAMESTAPSVSAIQEEDEEDQEDEEDDVPLAVKVKSAKSKGKQRAVETPEPENDLVSSPVAMKGTGPASPTKLALARIRGPVQRSNSWKDVVIPSSEPQERSIEAEPRSAKPKTPVPQIARPPPKTRSVPRKAKAEARKHLVESSDEDEDVAIPDPDDDDKDTLPAEDEMDVDQPGPSTKPTRGGKRKRTVSSSTRKNSAKSNSGTKVVKEESSTPASSRPTKRLKSGSSARAGSVLEPTRVFALWKKDGHYYSGTVHAQAGQGRYNVHFDDDQWAVVELKFMRHCRLRAGDNVLLPPRTRAKVTNVPPCGAGGHASGATVTVDLDEDGEEDVRVATMHLAPRTVSAEWADRTLTDDMISAVVRPRQVRRSSTPQGEAAPSEAPKRKPLKKTGVVITMASADPLGTREALVTAIRENGGVVLDDWSALFEMQGTSSQRNQRYVWKAEDIACTEREDVRRAFLVSDDNNQKAKFLIALALGIPCLSVEWVKKVLEEGEDVDWQPYLLPAGFSEHLNTRVSQLVDLDWGNSQQHLKEITGNLAPAKVFSDMDILCVSEDFVPRRRVKTNPEGKAAAEAVPKIILSMGAASVEAVNDEKYASRSLREYSYIVFRDEHDNARWPAVERCVDVNWVKDCLISGRLLPLPPRRAN